MNFHLWSLPDEHKYKTHFSEDQHPSVYHRPASEQLNGPADDWEERAQEELQRALNVEPKRMKAKNVILFIGDGMGVSTITAARWHNQQLKGSTMAEAKFGFEHFDHVGVSMVSLFKSKHLQPNNVIWNKKITMGTIYLLTYLYIIPKIT